MLSFDSKADGTQPDPQADARSGPQSDKERRSVTTQWSPSWLTPVLVLGILIAGVITLGYLYINKSRVAFEDEVMQNLSSVSALKAAQVTAWRAERAGDAQVLSADITLMPVVQRILRAEANAREKRETSRWLDQVRANYKYKNLALISPKGAIIQSSGPLLGDDDHYRELAAAAMKKDDLIFGDLVQVKNGPIHIDLSISLKNEKQQRIGVLLLGIEPNDYLFPALYDWPAPGRTGEVLLMRQEGEMIRILNETRLTPGAAMKLTIRALPQRPARTASGFRLDQRDRLDQRGMHVVVSTRQVGDSPWYVAAKIDRSEIFAPQRRDAAQLIGILILFLLFSAAVVALIVSRQRSLHYREKYEAESQRVELLKKYDILFHGGNDAILLWEGEGRIVDVNERTLQLFGYTREEMLQLTVLDLKPEGLFDEARASMKVISEEQRELVRESMNRKKDGSLFPTEISISRIETATEPFFQSIVRDISERKGAEEQIKRLNRLYAVLSGCDAAVFRARTETDLFHQVCRIVVDAGGFPAAGIRRLDPVTKKGIVVTSAGPAAACVEECQVTAADTPMGQGTFGRSVREGRPVTTNDNANDTSMGPWREISLRYGVRSSVSLPINHRGQIPYVLGIYSSTVGFFSDEEMALVEKIGESLASALERMALERDHDKAERERQRAQERLELVLDAAKEGYYDWQIDTDQWYVSPRLCAMLGIELGDSKMKDLRDIVHPEDRPLVEKALVELLQDGGTSSTVELRIVQKNGHHAWMLTRAKVVARDAQGRPQRLVGSAIDITAQKSLEQQFAQAQKMESVGRLAGGVAHDFNNLLGVVIGFTEILQERLPEGSELRPYTEDVLQAANRAVDLTRQLLAFGRKQVLQPRVLAVNDLVEDFQKMLRRVIHESIEIRPILNATEGLISADAGQIEQVIMNLAVNARDAMPDGGTLTIETQDVDVDDEYAAQHVSAKPGPFVMIAVTDTGTGMTPEVQERIFEPFFTTKEKGKGTGLGLGSVYGIVQQSGGWIWVYSELGKGTAFKIYLPRVSEDGRVTSAAPEIPADLPRGTETILVAEDEPNMRRLAQSILERLGYKVVTAANGALALRMAEEYPETIHLLLTDAIMPEMGGRELSERIAIARPQIQVLFMSGYTSDGALTQGIQASEVAFIQKPFTAVRLAQKIHEVLAPNRAKNAGLV